VNGTVVHIARPKVARVVHTIGDLSGQTPDPVTLGPKHDVLFLGLIELDVELPKGVLHKTVLSALGFQGLNVGSADRLAGCIVYKAGEVDL